jgi:hypothetical protein
MAWSDLGAPWPHGADFWELVITSGANVLVVVVVVVVSAVNAAFAAVAAAIVVGVVVALVKVLSQEPAFCSSQDCEG